MWEEDLSYRYQAMACYDQDTRLVETARCNSHGEECAHTHARTHARTHAHTHTQRYTHTFVLAHMRRRKHTSAHASHCVSHQRQPQELLWPT